MESHSRPVRSLVLLAAALIIGLAGCGSKPSSTLTPTITGISPNTGFTGTSATIVGTNFGATQEGSTVAFNGTNASVTRWSPTSIDATVPDTATTGNVVVTVQGQASNGVLYTVNPAPSITSLSHTLGAIGTPITITGSNFAATQGASTVTFNGTNATVTSWSATTIAVTVPAAATTGNLIVTVAGLGAEVFFTVVTPPNITGLSQSSGPVGTPVTITGTNFGASQGNSSVAFHGFAAPVTSWSATSIAVTVPAAATTGSVVVTFAGVVPSNAVLFTIAPNAVSSCGAGSESILQGKYAYYLQGFVGSGVGGPVARMGSFTANGSGGIAGGDEDLNVSSGHVNHAILASGSSYSIGSDNRGCVTLAYAGGGTATFRFSVAGISSVVINSVNVNVAFRGRVIQFDDNSATGAGTRGAGVMVRQDPTAFVGSAQQANYAFGLDGEDPTGGHVGMAGSFTFNNSTGGISAGYFDYNDAGAIPFGAAGTAGASSGSIALNSIDAGTGRTTGVFNTGTVNGSAYAFTWAVYIVNANQFFIVATDTFGGNTPIAAGRAISTGAPNSFQAASLSGSYIVHMHGLSNGDAGVNLLLLKATPADNPPDFSATSWQYSLGNIPAASSQPLAGDYVVDPASGRVSLSNTGQNHPPVFYLDTPGSAAGVAGFILGTDSSGSFGLINVQGATTIANGHYGVGTSPPADNTVINQSGSANFAANVAGGTLDQSGLSGLATSAFSNITFTANANGSVTAIDSGGSPIVGIPNGTSIYFIDELGPATIAIGEQ